MERPSLTVADVIRAHGDAFLALRGGRVSPAQRRVLFDLARCRTEALGGHVFRCESCGAKQIAYNACRSRHCSSCLAYRSVAWLEARRKELLDVEYFHVVFTLPQEIAALSLGNKQVIYDLLFQASAATLKKVARDPKQLGVDIGFLSVLHPASQELLPHPHVHCVVPGGGIKRDGSAWVSSRRGFFLPVRVLSRVFRGKFMAGLEQARSKGELRFGGGTAKLSEAGAWSSWVADLRAKEWVVYAKRPFGSPEIVLKYLARYTHRGPISDRRLLSMKDGRVTFRCRDRKAPEKHRAVTLDASEFIRRLLQHILPKGFRRIRQYGFLSNRDRTAKIKRCRELIVRARADVAGSSDTSAVDPSSADDGSETSEGRLWLCPHCGGKLVRTDEILTAPRPSSVSAVALRVDTS
jgi:hypothetical protein